MKKILFILVTVFTFSFVNAQDMSFGIKAGLNYGANKTSDSDFNDQFDPILVFHFGAYGEFSLSDKFSLQPELLYTTSGADFKSYSTIGGEITSDLKYRLNYLNIPITAKYYVVDNLSLEVGPYIGFLLSATEDGSLKSGDIVLLEADKIDKKENYKSTDFGMGLGAGYKLDNGLSFSLRYNLSLMDINDNPELVGETTRRSGEAGTSSFTMSNNIIQFSIGFTFN
jgi:hypothetical protein